VLFHREVRVALEEEDILADVVGLGEAFVDIPELESGEPVDVPRTRVVMDRLVRRRQKRLLDRLDHLERLVLDADRAAGCQRGLLVHRRDRRHRVAHEADLLVLQSPLILGRRHDAVLRREIIAGDHRRDPGHGRCATAVHRQHAGMRMGATQDLDEQRPGQLDVVRVGGSTGQLAHRVHSRQRLPNDPQIPL